MNFSYVSVIFSVVLAWLFHWNSLDLIWGLWFSSLSTGILFICVASLGGHPDPRKNETVFYREPWGVRIGSALFTSIHFSAFMLAESSALTRYFPPTGFALAGGDLDYIWTVARQYWTLATLTLFGSWKEITNIKELRPITPYVNVIRIQFLIFLFALLENWRAPDLVSYAAILLVFSPIGKKKTEGEDEATPKV